MAIKGYFNYRSYYSALRVRYFSFFNRDKKEN